MSPTATAHKLLGPQDGLRLNSGPGRDLIFKVTGEDSGGALDYFVVEVAPKGGPPLHVHHSQNETLHVMTGAFQGPDRRRTVRPRSGRVRLHAG